MPISWNHVVHREYGSGKKRDLSPVMLPQLRFEDHRKLVLNWRIRYTLMGSLIRNVTSSV